MRNFEKKEMLIWVNRARKGGSEVFKELQEAQIPVYSSSLAYTTILSIVPMLAVGFSIFEFTGGVDRHFEDWLKPIIIENLNQETGGQVVSTIQGFIGNIHAGALGITGFFALIITSMSMLSSIEKIINKVWKTSVKRTFLQRIAAYWMLISLGPFAISVAIGALSSNSLESLKSVTPAGFWAILITFGIFLCTYKLVPNTKVKWPSAILGSTYATIMWFVVKNAYSGYTSSVVTYNKIYGSLAVIPLFILWIYLIWFIILSGVAVCFVVQNRIINRQNRD